MRQVEMPRASSPGLWPHQVEAVKAVVAEIALDGRCWTAMACGTGKTLVGAEVSRQVAESGRVLVIVPTLELLAQTARSYVAHLGGHAGTIGAVCSDSGATVAAGELQAELDELHVGSTTDPREVGEWTRRRGRLTVLSTYASLPVIAAAHAEGACGWDLLVVDEAHRSAGRVDRAWHVVHEDEAIPACRRLYMTATPRIIGTDRFETTSMDDERVFGPEVYQMPFAQAIDEGLLADYKVLVTTMTEAELRKLDTGPDTVVNAGGPALPAQMLVAQLALLKAASEYGVRRAITFHHRVASARQFARTLRNAADLLPSEERPQRLYTAAVDGGMALEERREILRHLDRPSDRLVSVSNARVLGEGVDVPELDAVLFADPRNSATDVVQAAGRALRRGKTAGKTAYIIVPILLHEAETLDEAVDSSAWDVLYRVLRAMRAHDERLADWLDTHRARLTAGDRNGQEPSQRHPLPPWLHLTGTPVDHTFAAALRLRIVEQTTSVWLAGLAAARTYQAAYGNLRVPAGHVTDDEVALGKWIIQQRHEKRKNTLSQKRIDMLDELGMVWDPKQADWEEQLDAARGYHAEHGHLRVPHDTTVGEQNLGEWIKHQRVLRRKRELTAERIALLDELGMVWDPKQIDWEDWLDAARAYHAEHGNLDVRSEFETTTGKRLGHWICMLRVRKDRLTAGKIAALDRLGMDWDGPRLSWEQKLAFAATFHAENGHLRAPKNHVLDGFDLCDWIERLRNQRTDGCLSDEQVAALDTLGMDWAPRSTAWRQRYGALVAFLAEHGHTRVRQDHVTQHRIPLGRWVTDIRRRKRTGTLDPERVAALNALGFDWNPPRGAAATRPPNKPPVSG